MNVFLISGTYTNQIAKQKGYMNQQYIAGMTVSVLQFAYLYSGSGI